MSSNVTFDFFHCRNYQTENEQFGEQTYFDKPYGKDYKQTAYVRVYIIIYIYNYIDTYILIHLCPLCARDRIGVCEDKLLTLIIQKLKDRIQNQKPISYFE